MARSNTSSSSNIFGQAFGSFGTIAPQASRDLSGKIVYGGSYIKGLSPDFGNPFAKKPSLRPIYFKNSTLDSQAAKARADEEIRQALKKANEIQAANRMQLLQDQKRKKTMLELGSRLGLR